MRSVPGADGWRTGEGSLHGGGGALQQQRVEALLSSNKALSDRNRELETLLALQSPPHATQLSAELAMMREVERCLTGVGSRTNLNLTCRDFGSHSSSLQRKSARAQIRETEITLQKAFLNSFFNS